MNKNIVLWLFIFSILGFDNVMARTDEWRVIKLKDGASIEEFLAGTGLNVNQFKIGSHNMIKVPADLAVVMAGDMIEYGEVDAQAEIQATVPDDYFYDKDQWNLTKIGMEQVWDDNRGTKNVVVAVLDTGLNKSHEDMAGLVWINEDELADNGIDDDDNGYIDDVNGYNLIKENFNNNDDNGHGTAVSSIIGANTDNQTGIAGVNWQVSIMPVKVASSSGTASLYDIAQGIYYAVDNGADLINMSLGSSTDRDFLEEAVKYAYDNDVLMVAASGNSSSSSSLIKYPLFPAAYDEVIAVGATEINDEVANLNNSTFISHYGNNLDMVAPGVEILTADGENDDGYLIYDGTSMATPHVVGVAALMLSKNPNLTDDEIRQILLDTAFKPESMSGDFDVKYGFGRLDAQAAMAAVMPPVVDGDDDDDGDDDGSGDYPTGNLDYEFVAVKVSQSNDWYLKPGEQREVSVIYKNIGDSMWPVRNNWPVRLGTVKNLDRSSVFFDSESWLTSNRIASYNVSDVAVGSNIEFRFNIEAPDWQNNYKECFALVMDGVKWFDDTEVCFNFQVTNQEVFSSAWKNQADYLTLKFGETGESWIEFVNNGTAVWERAGISPVHLGTDRPMDRYSLFHDESSWLADNRIELEQAQVQPGETGRFNFGVISRSKGVFSEYFRPVVEGRQWLPDEGVFLKYTII